MHNIFFERVNNFLLYFALYCNIDVDASGKRESGVYGGNTLWYGSFSECDKLPDSRYCWTVFPGNITLFKNYEKVDQFCLITITNSCNQQKVHLKSKYRAPYELYYTNTDTAQTSFIRKVV